MLRPFILTTLPAIILSLCREDPRSFPEPRCPPPDRNRKHGSRNVPPAPDAVAGSPRGHRQLPLREEEGSRGREVDGGPGARTADAASRDRTSGATPFRLSSECAAASTSAPALLPSSHQLQRQPAACLPQTGPIL